MGTLGQKEVNLLLSSCMYYPGYTPFSLPLSPACCAPSTLGTTYRARYQFSGPSPLFVLPTAGGGGQALKVDDDRERGAQDDSGGGQPCTRGAEIWLAVWLLMPSPGKVAELRGEDAIAESSWEQELLWKPSSQAQDPLRPPHYPLWEGLAGCTNF